MSNASTLVDLLGRTASEHGDRTAYVFLADGEREAESLTYAELDQRARAVAAALQDEGLAGRRVALSYPSGLNFVVALHACFYAGAAAVPIPLPGTTGYGRARERIRGILDDCGASAVLVGGEEQLREEDVEGRALLVRTDLVGEERADAFEPVAPTPETLAILQYTSGSTSSPRGVMVSHGNMLANLSMMHALCEEPAGSTTVGWLPLHHDMGLFGIVLRSLYVQGRCVLMAPSAFLRKPIRWLRAISRYEAFISGGPNFAYDMCVDRTKPEDRAELDLASWEVAFNGAEPVRPRTLERFARTFAEAGFRRRAFKPMYGLAEGTLLVTGVGRGEEPAVHAVSGEALRRGEVIAVPAGGPDAKMLASCGGTRCGLEVRAVDPETRLPAGAGRIGEIWVRGESVSRGYWGRPDETAESLEARLADGDGGPYLRTGDLGCLIDGGLVVTGRIKDLIVIRGANYYPQDIEETVENVDGAFRPSCGAAFSRPRAGEERLVVVQELKPAPGDEPAEIGERIRQAVAAEYGLAVDRLVFVRPGQVPKTSSGKVQRALCRRLLAEGGLRIVHDDRPGEGAGGGGLPHPETVRAKKKKPAAKTRGRARAPGRPASRAAKPVRAKTTKR